jgi:thiamine kinase-like enzyme
MAHEYVGGVARLEEILTRLQRSLGALSGEPAPLSGGITNHNFRVTLGGEEYVVRVHGRDTKLLGIDRTAERLACGLAADLKIAPEMVAAFDDCLVTRFIACDPVSPHDVAASVAEIARALRSFHDSRATLPARFWVPDLLQDYGDRVHELGVRLPAAYGRAAAVAARIAAALSLRDPRPCHNDLLTSNLIRAQQAGSDGAPTAGDAMLIVDWEYAGMGHPCFDLGNLSVNNDFDEATDERLLSAYYGEAPSDARRAVLALMRILSDAREAAWGVLQAEISELDFDFNRYARTHFERLSAAVEEPQLEEWLAAASAAAADASTREENDGQTT